MRQRTRDFGMSPGQSSLSLLFQKAVMKIEMEGGCLFERVVDRIQLRLLLTEASFVPLNQIN